MTFKSLHLIEPLLNSVEKEGYNHPTPIQIQTIPHVLSGNDVLACAQTGTGKTAAFALPILQLLTKAQSQSQSHSQAPHRIRVLVLTPTRELASQIGDSFTTYGKGLNHRNTVIFGGV